MSALGESLRCSLLNQFMTLSAKGIGYLSLPRASQDMSPRIDMSLAQTSPGQRDQESCVCNELQGHLSSILNFLLLLLNCEMMEEFYRK